MKRIFRKNSMYSASPGIDSERTGILRADFPRFCLAGYAEIEVDMIATFDNKLQNVVTRIANR
jgi:hypothetical protein